MSAACNGEAAAALSAALHAADALVDKVHQTALCSLVIHCAANLTVLGQFKC